MKKRKNVMRKDFFMEISRTRNRFISIFLIVAMGVAFFSGVRASEPDMRYTADDYYDANNLMDIRIQGTLGLTDEDVAAVLEVEGVAYAMGSYTADVLCWDEDTMSVYKVMADMGTYNQIDVIEGRLPETAGECLIDAGNLESSEYSVGDVITIESGDDSDIFDTFTTDTYTIVGIGSSSEYITFSRGSTTIGDGELDGFLIVSEDSFATDYYMKIDVWVEGAADLVANTDEYEELVTEVLERIEDTLSDVRCEARYTEVYDEAMAEIADAQEELDEAQAEADEELADALAELLDAQEELEEGEASLADALEELEEAMAEIADGEAEIEDGWAQIEASEAELEEAYALIEENEAALESGLSEIEAGEAALEEAYALIEENEATLAAALEQIEASETELEDGWAEYYEGLEAYETQLAAADLTAAQEELDAAKEELAAAKEALAQQKEEAYVQAAAAATETAEAAVTEAAASTIAQLDAAEAELTTLAESLAEAVESLELLETQLAQTQAAIALLSEESDETADASTDTSADTDSSDSSDTAADTQSTDDLDTTADTGSTDASDTTADTGSTDDSDTTADTGSTDASDSTADTQDAQDAESSSALTELLATQTLLQEQIAILTQTIAVLQATYEESYESGMAQIEEGRAQIEAAKVAAVAAAIEEAYAQVDSLFASYEAEIEESEALIEENEAALASAQAQLEEAYEQLTAAYEELTAGEEALAAAKEEAEAGEAELEAAKAELASQQETLAAAKEELEAGEEALAAAKEEAAAGAEELAAAKEELAEAEAEIADAKEQAADGEAEIADAQAELEDGRIELADGWEEYEDGKAEADAEIADAQAEIDDALAEVADISYPEWYVTDRTALNGYTEMGDNAERMKAIGQVFPVLFFLVAALISLTTMTRMVEEERTQIGTLKALGYGKGAIAKKYMFYALLATVGGSVVGALIGEKILPYIIINAYKIMYPYIPNTSIPYIASYALIASGAALVCVLGATIAACYKELSAVPAQLMRPVPPKQGHRIFLERITPLWKRISFTQKSTLRNLFRYKKRFFMTIFGISGCMGLMVLGFGLKDSISAISSLQYDQIQLYTAMVIVDEDASDSEKSSMYELLDSMDGIYGYTDAYMMNMDVDSDSGDWEAYLVVLPNETDLSDFLYFSDRITGEEYTLTDAGVIICEKTADKLGVGVGDTIYLKEDTFTSREVVIAAVCENYVGHYIYMTEALYEETYGEAPGYNYIYVNMDASQEEDIALALLSEESVLSISNIDSLKESIDNILGALDIIVVVLITAAGMLAFVVLYNLNNININERRRELASIRVLGFYDGELAAYVYRENIYLTIIGILIGCVFGKVLHQFVIQTVEIDSTMFGRTISIESYVYSILLTIVFSIIVNVVMFFKLRKIDMVESLKSVE